MVRTDYSVPFTSYYYIPSCPLLPYFTVRYLPIFDMTHSISLPPSLLPSFLQSSSLSLFLSLSLSLSHCLSIYLSFYHSIYLYLIASFYLPISLFVFQIKDISDFKRLDKNMVMEMDRVLTHDIPLLLQKVRI